MKISLLLILTMFVSCYNEFGKNPIYSTKIFSGQYGILMQFVKNQDTILIKNMIIKNHLNPDHVDSIYGLGLLNWCIFNDKERSFEKILQLGANPNFQGSKANFAPPIIEAAKSGLTSVFLKLCLRYGGDVNLFSSNISASEDLSPVFAAVSSNRVDNLELLIANGANINLTTDSCCTPLAQALSIEYINMAECLIKNGADYTKLNFKTKAVLLDKNNQPVLDKNGSPIIKSYGELNVLDFLRKTQFQLNSNDYRTKMRIVAFLKSRGYDYWSYPIPDSIKELHKGDVDYLSKY